MAMNVNFLDETNGKFGDIPMTGERAYVLDLSDAVEENPALKEKRMLDMFLHDDVTRRFGHVSMTLKDMDSWHEFIDALPASFHGISCQSSFVVEKQDMDLDHSFTCILAKFAVDTFNAICMHYVKMDLPKVCLVRILDAKYVRRPEGYFYYLLLEGMENGKRNNYEAVVLTDTRVFDFTLMRFVLSPKPSVDKKKAKEAALGVHLKPRGKVMSVKKKDRDRITVSELRRRLQQTTIECSVGCIPDEQTGLVRRERKDNCRGYNYFNQSPG